jgi:hypothetical protein
MEFAVMQVGTKNRYGTVYAVGEHEALNMVAKCYQGKASGTTARVSRVSRQEPPNIVIWTPKDRIIHLKVVPVDE